MYTYCSFKQKAKIRNVTWYKVFEDLNQNTTETKTTSAAIGHKTQRGAFAPKTNAVDIGRLPILRGKPFAYH